MAYKNKSLFKRKAFTLIELLIVIAIIGILFIVLISKVDFATDKAKATGVQTDFRSFQVAIESVAKENAGLATFGWDTGDTNGNRIRDSYDKGDTNQNGKQDDGEVFVGSKTYGETWTNVYTLTNPADVDDKSAIAALEAAINKNLDPKLNIVINDDYTITMANQAQDPWNTEYHGYYITNAANDGNDRGAIVLYSNGANQEFGSDHSISGGVVVVNVPGNNVYGKDDYSLAVVYTYVNGYGEVKTTTTGFSQNQGGGQAGNEGLFVPGEGSGGSGTYTPLTTGDAYAIYDSTTQSLYFVRAESEPEIGSTFTASNGKTINVTKVYSDFENRTDYYVYDNWEYNELNVLADWSELRSLIKYIEAIDVIKPKNLEGWFLQFTLCTEIYLDNFDTSDVTSMRMTFQGVGSDIEFPELFYIPMLSTGRNWETGEIVSWESEPWEFGGVIRGMQNWDTSNVTTMDCMFANVGGYYFDVRWFMYVDDVSNWDVSKVMDFNGMFAMGEAWPYNQDLTKWDIQEDALPTTGFMHYSGPNIYICTDIW